MSNGPVHGDSNQADVPAVSGSSDVSDGTRGDTRASARNGVVGGNESTDAAPAGQLGGNGVFGFTTNANASGVFGANNSTNPANAPGGSGVFGLTRAPGAAGVFGSNNGPTTGRGVQGNGPEAGVGGFSERGIGVLAQSGAIALKAVGPLAGRFEGNVEVTGDISLVNQDCAEDFTIAADAYLDPGTVVVLKGDGELSESAMSYDKRVAGVISGAGGYKPGLILDNKQSADDHRVPVALMGKVYCKVDAQYGSIEVGDLLTTSATPGHAMKVQDPMQAFGAVIGKALRSLAKGKALVPILVALQ